MVVGNIEGSGTVMHIGVLQADLLFIHCLPPSGSLSELPLDCALDSVDTAPFKSFSPKCVLQPPAGLHI